MKYPIKITGISAHKTTIQNKAKNVEIWFDERKFVIPKLLCFPDMHGDMVLGNNFIEQYLPMIVEKQTVSLHVGKIDNLEQIKIPLLDGPRYKCSEGFSPKKNSDTVKINEETCELEQTHWLYRSLKENFSDNPLKLWNRSPRFCKIELRDENVIIRVSPMFYTRQDIDEFDNQIKELLDGGLIEKTTSPHSSPAFMVRNFNEIKRKKPRMVINYKRLNQNLKFDGYFIPRKEVLINLTRGSTIFSKFDCKSGFWQLKMTEESKVLTAFSTPRGHYHWNVMPFGLNTAPQIFQRWMDSIFNDLKDFCVVYVDDILVFSRTREDHMKHLKIICSVFQKYGIILSPKKIELEKESIDFLGIILDKDGIQLQKHIISKIKDFPENIKDKKQLQSLLGLLNYGRGFLQGLTKQEIPLLKKLNKNQEFTWSDEDRKILRQIKIHAQNAPEVYLPKQGDKLILETDASDECWGCVLKAIPKEFWDEEDPPLSQNGIRMRRKNIPQKILKHEKICGYNSGKFKPNEVKWIIFEKELYTIRLALAKFQIYLAPEFFVVKIDNKAVRDFLVNTKKAIGKKMQWYNEIAQYSFEVEHVKGKGNFIADLLSIN